MQFRPCIDIHNGKVKQIVGSTLTSRLAVQENFVAQKDASYFAKIYKQDGLRGGHIIMLDQTEETKQQTLSAIKTFGKGLQVGGGITPKNALDFINAGASQVIITSYVFYKGSINTRRLAKISNIVGKDKLVLDLSCKKKEGNYYVVTNKWQTFTNFKINQDSFDLLGKYCTEFLVHGVDKEGKRGGVDEELLEMLGKFNTEPITYAGGIKNLKDVEKIKKLGKGKINFTIGSALDFFGGNIKYKDVIEKYVN